MTVTAELAPDVDRSRARRALLDLLDAHADAERIIPCRRWPDAGWTADDEAGQTLAARMCLPCPAVVPCREYGLALPKEAGAYGGLTEYDRRPARGRPTTHEEA